MPIFAKKEKLPTIDLMSMALFRHAHLHLNIVC